MMDLLPTADQDRIFGFVKNLFTLANPSLEKLTEEEKKRWLNNLCFLPGKPK